jgi:poly-gamma-glutamate synthesis protein (capsule biosynthesis protein)
MVEPRETSSAPIRLFFCGDVMTGRGVDQILAHPGPPEIHEPYVRDAREYVELAEVRNGPIARPVTGSYIWGDALTELRRAAPAVRIVNLETSVTASDDYWRGKGINYRMHPGNIDCLTAAGVHVCVLANNHVLDYGYPGLLETLDVLTRAGFQSAGAGRDLAQARAPAVVPLARGGRVTVFAFGAESSGIPRPWAASRDKPGVDLLDDLSEATAAAILDRIRRVRQPRDIVVASIHWGGNWGYDVSGDQVRFAHSLIDGGVDVVHGHSSHHPRPIEVYRNRVVFYGCGDFINDYEGISGAEQYRGDLVLMYVVTLSAAGELTALTMTPMQIRKMQLRRTGPADTRWVRDTLDRIGEAFGSHVALSADGTLTIQCS